VVNGEDGVNTAGRSGDPRGGVGILDVARYAGVSAATVSRALRGLPNVSRETRTKVLAAADELAYAASPLASALATGRMRSVGVVLPQAGRWALAEVVRGIEGALHRHGYDLVLHVLADDNRRAEFFGSLPVRRRVDALLLVGLDLSKHECDLLQDLGLPLAWVGEPMPGAHGDLVDDFEAARLAVRHLVELGHRRIALVGGALDEPNAPPALVRRTGAYLEALADAGIPLPRNRILDGELTASEARRAVTEVFAADDEPPTALLCQSDEMAFGALAALRALGLDCPEDVSVVGLDGHELAATFDLTTVARPLSDLGAFAARWLVARLAEAEDDEDDDEDDDPDGGEQLRIHPVRLDVRDSTGPPRERVQAMSAASSG
jgi:LacI family transcriptional regulator, repressor for deo operon, udp, cdd, tsx, nupC, and nupG